MKKRAVTLLEIMIVIFLISLIGGVVGYNMKGSLNEGRVFKTEQAINQIEDIVQLAMAEGKELNSDDVEQQVTYIIKNSPLVKSSDKLLKDGWNQPFDFSFENDKLKIDSKKLEKYKKKKNNDEQRESEE